AEHELELWEAIEGAREDDARQKLRRDDLEHRGPGSAIPKIVFLLHRVVGRLARGIAGRMERDRHAAFLRRLPKRIPGAMPDRVARRRDGEAGALEAEPRRAS